MFLLRQRRGRVFPRSEKWLARRGRGIRNPETNRVTGDEVRVGKQTPHSSTQRATSPRDEPRATLCNLMPLKKRYAQSPLTERKHPLKNGGEGGSRLPAPAASGGYPLPSVDHSIPSGGYPLPSGSHSIPSSGYSTAARAIFAPARASARSTWQRTRREAPRPVSPHERPRGSPIPPATAPTR
ncbi:hypothetical protein HMPREF1219_00245 [Corynebacterium pyruviciproducens ATCC BAA-1742]|uniref:Uncharacterized protein n=1 Tax=Corynebacterium pyruviciproducens ATCC BAA-1742 TaxID=1125779 RepID=S2Z9B4_9CORY|nr:hypothetical protein HMPREF1219_00245 [Corynebacterium pyruviciproducens ATCC BAA-1742]